MGKKKKGVSSAGGTSKTRQENGSGPKTQDSGTTLKDLLSADVLGKLKAQADELKQSEADRKERQRLEAEEAKRREQKLRENDFSYLLDNSDAGGGKYS